MSGNTLNQSAVQIYNQQMPKGSVIKTVPLIPILAANTPYIVDMTNAQSRGIIDQVQSIWVDNSAGLGTLTINTGVVNQNIVIPAGAQGFIPALVSNPPVFTLTASVAMTPKLQFINVPMPIGLWQSVTETFSTALPGTSSEVLTGGTATVAVTGPFRGAIINNPLTAAGEGIATAEPIYINLVGAATLVEGGNNFALQPGQSFTAPTGFSGNISVNATTSGHVFSVLVW